MTQAEKIARMQRKHEAAGELINSLWGIIAHAVEQKKAGKRVSFDAQCQRLLKRAEQACNELDGLEEGRNITA